LAARKTKDINSLRHTERFFDSQKLDNHDPPRPESVGSLLLGEKVAGSESPKVPIGRKPFVFNKTFKLLLRTDVKNTLKIKVTVH
jgi:hypothetical protein